MDYIFESILLDLRTFSRAPIPLLSKIELVIRKYFIIIICHLSFQKGKSFGRFLGSPFSFPNRFGLLSLQRILVDGAFLTKYIPRGLSYVDIGAHAGEFAWFARKCLGAEKVLSIEPDKETYALLKKNIPPGSANITYRAAISDKNSWVTLFRSQVSSQLNTIIHPDKEDSALYQSTQRVRCMRLDDLMKNRYPSMTVDVLKIDVEGAEYQLLKGGVQIAKRARYIFLEVHVVNNESTSFLKLCAFIRDKLPLHEVIALNHYTSGDRSIDILLEKRKIRERKK